MNRYKIIIQEDKNGLYQIKLCYANYFLNWKYWLVMDRCVDTLDTIIQVIGQWKNTYNIQPEQIQDKTIAEPFPGFDIQLTSAPNSNWIKDLAFSFKTFL